MRFILFLISAFAPFVLRAQCNAVDLNTLQNIENAIPDDKESKILAAGFDLRQALQKKGSSTKVYTKCWATSSAKKDYFQQKLFWDSGNDSIKFATLSDDQFKSIRKELDERHPAGVGASVVVGKRFTYYLAFEAIDGVDYYTVTLVKK